VTQRILRYANRGSTRIEFLTGVSPILLEFSGCDALDLWLQASDVHYRWEFTSRPAASSRFSVSNGHPRGRPPSRKETAGPYASAVLLRFVVDRNAAGWLRLRSLRPKYFAGKKLALYEGLAEILGLAIGNQRAQWALRERVKELTCLYGISRIAQLSGVALDEALQRIADLLPPAWQFPEIACGRILLDGRAYTAPGFREGPHRQSADLVIDGKPRGSVEVLYTGERPEFAEGPFLAEERSLIDTIAREVALLVERRETEAYRSMLQLQLRHADRLATIGQLAAGVAHELNEPLGSILGFAQLLQKQPDLPEGAAHDTEKIVRASLHAREVIHKLLVFSRQKTPVKTMVNLNRVVEEGLYFLKSRCATAGITVVCRLAPDLPEIHADASQLHQVLVNLVVNGIQAMPQGGTLTIDTRAAPGSVRLDVEDTGIGMSEEIQEKIYTPFFTTKDIDQGTGLGLAVVHGIVTSHGGAIRVESSPGKGARFEVRLPVAEPHE
ncbi:MAG TPA: ATP-binding protein, partial [Candidatus Sulfopaludibacter sp.]|nr:ATP-binding protein [Candidatus Sulfopaludibacter sp.]